MQSLEGKTALIPGAKGGLGTFVTNAFLAAGAKVLGVSRSIQAADFNHRNFTALPASLSTGDAARQIVSEAVARFGRLDVLVHVMGGFAGGTSVADTDDATLEAMLDVNFRAAFYIARAAIPVMRAQAAGRILAVASRQGVEPGAMVGAYSASKAALVALFKSIALENKDAGITANTVLPGAMDTPGNAGLNLANLLDPGQVAALLVHLAGDGAADITGAAIPVYGRQL